MQTEYTNKVLTVSELTFSIKSLLETKFTFVTLSGEISNFKHQSSGHMYFSLKDANSQISAALFRGNAKNLEKMPKDGDEVIVEAEVSVYPPRGNYQLIVRKLSYSGKGDLLIKLNELKEKLKNEGLFDKSHKKDLPILPKKIGIVTSPTGSVIQDILHVLKRRFSNFHLILNPVKVQGEGSALEIAKAIDDFNKYNLVEVLIIGRGGGSLEDLWAFNEEIVAKAIFASKIPIISAVGHETDVSISDFVADVRAPTPSAAAEIVIKEKAQFLDTIKYFETQIAKILSYKLDTLKVRLENFKNQSVFSSPYTLLGKQMQMLDDLKNSIDSSIKQKLISQKELLKLIFNQTKSLNPLLKIKDLKEDINEFSNRLNLSFENYFSLKKERLAKLIDHLKAIDPKNLLKKGYSILFNEKKNSIILSTKDINEDDEISAMVSDGKIYAKVERKKNDS
ncbi:MAG: Exodeoxyribonuclease 7 large subunit [Candidatus Anoxychlamydiales bacterium]|nr:Exodeoxyribonuclease 7 large subunit [Candidatus Anoxychlamydiales bacterium]